jgi:pyruvate/2-oxoglutarate dehydrogenase complex dihydrolipoamide dehydrogenase (E3) component
MAQTFARLGSEVFLLDVADQILPRDDPDAATVVDQALRRDGVTILSGGKDLKLSPADHGIRFTVESGGPRDEVVDRLLVAVGRAPNVEGMNLEAVGVEYSKKGVKVNDRMQTTNPGIYAAGDICSPYQFTHAADFMARIVIQNTLFMGRTKASALTIPWCTYTEPEIAHVGLYEKDARERGMEVDTFTQEMSGVDRAILEGDTEGFVRVHVKKGSDEIVGATIVAAHAGDMISEMTLAMVNKIGLKKVASTIHPYPTQAEAIRKVGDLYNKTRLTPRVAGIMGKWLSWTR